MRDMPVRFSTSQHVANLILHGIAHTHNRLRNTFIFKSYSSTKCYIFRQKQKLNLTKIRNIIIMLNLSGGGILTIFRTGNVCQTLLTCSLFIRLGRKVKMMFKNTIYFKGKCLSCIYVI